MKKIIILTSFICVSIAQAGTMGVEKSSCNPDNVTVSCPASYWDLGISALYLQPNTESNLLNPILLAPNNKSHTINSPWDWGFLLEGSYHFNTGNDINLNWLHFSPDYTKSYFGNFTNNPLPQPFTTDLKFDTNVDIVNFEFAQTSHLGKKTNIRYFGGTQYIYAKINRTIHEFEITSFEPVNTLFQESKMTTRFGGFGPRLGIDMTRDLKYGFALFAQGAMALLVGESKAKLAGANISTINVYPFSAYGKKTHIVPELEAQLGANYQWDTKNGQFGLWAGWYFQHYFDLFILPPGESINPATIFTQNNLSLDGPFIKGTWVSAS